MPHASNANGQTLEKSEALTGAAIWTAVVAHQQLQDQKELTLHSSSAARTTSSESWIPWQYPLEAREIKIVSGEIKQRNQSPVHLHKELLEEIP